MKKALSLILALLMLFCVLVSCADNTDQPSETTAVSQGTDSVTKTEETTDKYQLADNVPTDLKYTGKTVTILSRGRDWCRDEVSVTDLNGEYINDAIYNRNLAVEERLGIKINNIMTDGTDNYEIAEKVSAQVLANTDDFDLFANSVYASIIRTGEGIYKDLYECEYLDLEQPWWSQGFNDAASIGPSQYFATGAVCLSTYRFIFATFFNRNVLMANNIEMPYSLVNDGKWTLDKQYEITSGIYSDLNGNTTKDIDDSFGFVTNGDQIGVDPYWSSCELTILSKTSDNYLEYSLSVDHLTAAVEKINNLIWSNPGAFSISKKSADSEQTDIAAKFASGTAAMVTLRIIEVEGANLRDMTDDYGIIPIPKFDERQDSYHSYVHDTVSAYAIPANVNDEKLEMVGATLELLAAESYHIVTPAYYEVALKEKYVNDPESVDMLDLIVDTIYIDAGVLYTKKISSVHQQLRSFIGSNNNNVASTMKGLSKAVPKQLEALVAGIKKIQGVE